MRTREAGAPDMRQSASGEALSGALMESTGHGVIRASSLPDRKGGQTAKVCGVRADAPEGGSACSLSSPVASRIAGPGAWRFCRAGGEGALCSGWQGIMICRRFFQALPDVLHHRPRQWAAPEQDFVHGHLLRIDSGWT